MDLDQMGIGQVKSSSGMTIAPLTSEPSPLDPAFDLRPVGIYHQPAFDQLEKVRTAYADCYAVEYVAPMLILRFSKLPEKPWPVMIGRLPAWFTEDKHSQPIPLGEFSLKSTAPPICTEQALQQWKTPRWEDLEHLCEQLITRGIDVMRLDWLAVRIRVLVRGPAPDGWRARIPSRSGNVFLTFSFNCEPLDYAALRLKMPTTDGDVDDSDYQQDLRPGVTLSSSPHADGLIRATTSGVCVIGSSGEKLITCASQGFPRGKDMVYHPRTSPNTMIGSVVWRSAINDLALLRLKSGIPYARETFSSSADDGVKSFRNLLDPREMRTFDIVWIDTPYNGAAGGLFLGLAIHPIPVEPRPPKYDYVKVTVSYFGNGASQLIHGCCGAVTWNDDWDVFGQFHYADEDNYCFMPCFNELIERGYSLSEIP